MNRAIVELREVIQKLVPLLTGRGLKVTQVGAQAYVQADRKTGKPVRVNIPSIPDNASEDFINAIAGFVDHEVGHVLCTDWKVYGGDGIVIDKDTPEGRSLTMTHNIMEDTFVEREMMKMFPGSSYNLDRLHEHFLTKITGPALKQVKGDQEAEFSILIVVMMRALSGQAIFQKFMDDGDYWSHPLVQNLHMAMSGESLDLLKTAKNTGETFKVALEVHDILFHRKNQPEPPEQEEQSQKGQSQDKPEKQAGQGDGDGARDHSEAEDGEAGPGESGGEDDPQEGEGDAAAKGGEGNEEEKGDPDEGDGETGEDDDSGSDDAGASDDDAEAGDDADEQDDGGADADEAGDDGEDEGEDEAGDLGDDTEGDDAGSADAGGGDDEDDDEESASGALNEREASGDNLNDEDKVGEGDEDSGGGLGAGGGKSMFDLDPEKFQPVDLSSAIAREISDLAEGEISTSEYSVFTRDEDRIEPFEPPSSNFKDKWLTEMEDQVNHLVGPMQKEIERIMASKSYSILNPGQRRGRLHSPSLYRIPQADDRVFAQREIHKAKSTAVTLLVDNSGSMRGGRMATAMRAAYALASTLERVNIANEVLGFTTGNVSQETEDQLRDEIAKGLVYNRYWSIVMPVYKSFSERVSPLVKRRIASQINVQVGMVANTDGESLEYAAQRLLPRREDRKVMLVLSDGQPVGSGSHDHLRETVRTLERRGVEIVGIGIETSDVRHYYPRSLVLNNVADLPRTVMGELRRILT